MIFKQLFDQKSSTYTYLIASSKGREALIIDPVLENVAKYIELLKELSSAMMDASICGLGQAAPNPLLSVIKHFPSEVTN